MGIPTDGIAILLGLGAGILVFILARELFLWYFKINTMVKNQEAIIKYLQKIAEKDNLVT